MPILRLLLLPTLLLAGCAAAPPGAPTVVAYEGARVWDGASFHTRTIYVDAGEFVAAPRPERVARTVDLSGRWLTAPFGETHQHVTGPTERDSREFIGRGEFYVLNANTIHEPFRNSAPFFARPDTYDVIAAMGGLTLPGGHPEKLYVDVLTQYVYRGWDLERFLGNAFHYAPTLEATEAALDVLQAQGAGIVKTYLLTSEEFAERRDDAAYYGNKGLDPALFPEIVAAIHRRGLRAIVHVETDHDARVAAEAGTDLLMHLPGYGSFEPETASSRYRLADATIEALAASGASVVPTYGIAAARYGRMEGDDERLQTERPSHYALQRDNVGRLLAAGVPVLVGTDGFGGAASEASHLVAIEALTPTQALNALIASGPAIFPDRRIGCLDVGCEASFLLFDEDPRSASTPFSPMAAVKQGISVYPDEGAVVAPVAAAEE